MLVSSNNMDIVSYSKSRDVVGVYDTARPVPVGGILNANVPHEVAVSVRVVGMTLTIPSVVTGAMGPKLSSEIVRLGTLSIRISEIGCTLPLCMPRFIPG